MSDQKFLRPDGVVEWRPDARTKSEIVARGGHVISRGQLCTACLVGDWGMSLLKLNKTLCDLCASLEAEVTRRANLPDGKNAGQWDGGVIVIGETDHSGADSGPEAVEPVRRARDYRAVRLAPVFVQARALGVFVLEEGGPGQPPAELVSTDDLREHALIPALMGDRVSRYVEWLRELDPDGYALRAAVLADVHGLASWLRELDRKIGRAHARAELDRAARQAARTPRALAGAASGVMKAGRHVK